MRKISKQLVCQKYIFKLHSSRLRKAKWNLTLPIPEARRNDEVISLADSQVLRWLDELNGITDADSIARELKSEIKALRKEANGIQNRKRIKQLYAQLDEVQFKPDYLCVIIDRENAIPKLTVINHTLICPLCERIILFQIAHFGF